MKKAIIVFGLALSGWLGACNNSTTKNPPSNSDNAQTFTLDTTKLQSGITFYQCPMDLQVISDKPGNCPVCGMELSEMKKK